MTDMLTDPKCLAVCDVTIAGVPTFVSSTRAVVGENESFVGASAETAAHG